MNYGVVAGLGLGAVLVADYLFHPPLWWFVVWIGALMPVLSFLFARHAKSLYLAMDHYFDPHVKRDDEAP